VKEAGSACPPEGGGGELNPLKERGVLNPGGGGAKEDFRKKKRSKEGGKRRQKRGGKGKKPAVQITWPRKVNKNGKRGSEPERGGPVERFFQRTSRCEGCRKKSVRLEKERRGLCKGGESETRWSHGGCSS